MAHNVEPMDIDNIESDFDNKENSIHHSNVYPRTPCTEKGYEELDVSELNMKLRYSITPAASPMSKSYTANSGESKSLDFGDDNLNANLTRSLHSAISRGDVVNKSVKSLPLQAIPSEQFVDSNRNAPVLRPLDSTVVVDNNVTITVTQTNEIDENLLFPSSSSSAAPTPEATTPTKEIPRSDGGSPIMRGLKSVLNMFRSSQSPIPPADNMEIVNKQVLSPVEISTSTPENSHSGSAVLASTPIAVHKQRDGNVSKRSSPHKESIVFNEDLEKELLWKDETTILFSQEKIPIHKLFFQQPSYKETAKDPKIDNNLNSTVEYMDISFNDSVIKNKTITDLQSEGLNESDGEFVDCETTLSNDKFEGVIKGDANKDNKPEFNITQNVSATNLETTNVKQLPHDEESSKSELQSEPTMDTTSNEKEDIINEPVLQTENNLPGNSDNTEIKHEEIKETDTIKDACIDNQAGENVLPTGTQLGLNNSSTFGCELSETVPLQNVTLPSTTNIETCILATKEITAEVDNNICNSTLVLCKGNNSDSLASQGEAFDLKIEQEVETLPLVSDVCNTTYGTKAEDATFVKESQNESELFASNTTHPIKMEDKTFVKQNKGLSQISDKDTITNHTHIENSTFVKETEENRKDAAMIEDVTFIKETEKVPDDKTFTAKDDYSNFVKDIEVVTALEEKINTSTPSTDTDSPANIPLPDEDDNENEKSLGASMLVEEKVIPMELDTNNSIVTKLANENDVDEMPMKTAKSIDINNTINCPAVEEECTTAIGMDNKVKSTPMPDISLKTGFENIEPEDKHANLDSVKTTEIIRPDMLMGINESVTSEIPVAVEIHQSSFASEPIEYSQDVKIHSDVVDVIEEVSTILKETINVSSTGMSAIIDTNNMKTAKSELGNISALNIADTSENSLKLGNNEHIFASNIAANDTDIVVKIEDVKIVATEHSLQNLTGVFEKTAESDFIETKSLVPEFNEIKHIDEKITDAVPVEHPSEQLCTNTILLSNETVDIPLAFSTNAKNVFDPTEKNDVIIEAPNNDTGEFTRSKSDLKEDNLVEEIVLSEKNSPYVSVTDRIDSDRIQSNSEKIRDPFATKSRVVVTPPTSPKIVSKGYNFNFDEIDDPFATKTKIRMSPTPENSHNQAFNATFEEKTDAPQRDINKNRRKSQPERKRPIMAKKKLNATVAGSSKLKSNNANQHLAEDRYKDSKENMKIHGNNDVKSVLCKNDDNCEIDTPNQLNTTQNIDPVLKKSDVFDDSNKNVAEKQEFTDKRDVVVDVQETKSSVESLNTNEAKTPSSSEQSTYYSAGTSSSEGTVAKNVFNIPEIDDMNFNPFATKSKMRQSPPPGSEEATSVETDLAKPDSTDAELNSLDGNLETIISATAEDKECSNVSNTTCSSRATDEKDITVREVNTEDEDTVEGPFLEADGNDNDNLSDFDGEDIDMMQFSELPPQNIEENIESGEMFIDAEAFEFLLNQNKTNVVSDSGKESLFLKFDPLFAKRVSTDGVLAALNQVQKRQSTPKKMAAPLKMDATFDKAGPSTLNVTHDVEANVTAEESTEDLNVTVSKPTMVVTPAVNPVVTPRNKTTTPTSSNRRSITFTSPAMAVIDRLLSLSANNSLVGHDTTVTHASREQNEADLALTQLRELLADKEIHVCNLRSESKELKDRLSSLESQMRSLESESDERLRKVNELNEKLTEKTKLNKSMAAVVEEYERTIASLIAETEQDKKRNNEERIKLIKERDEQTAHLASMEVSFSDLHSKYEKSKQIILTCKANEDSYKKSIKEFEENLSKMQSNYELLKQHATSKLNHANQELEKMNRAHESEVLKMNAMIKRKELHITSLEETLAQKTKANEELTAICDELINKVG